MTTVTLPADLGIESAADLKTLLSPLLEHADTVVLDGAAVSRLHCASLQLITAFCKNRQPHGHATRLIASPALDQAVGLLGLDGLVDTGSTTPISPDLNQEKSE